MTPNARLQSIIDHGNRGHNYVSDNFFECADGFRLSVIAGGGTYCLPQPQLCACGVGGFTPSSPAPGGVPHDYPGPYIAVEVADLAKLEDTGDGISMLSIKQLHALIAEHGGLIEDWEVVA